MVHTIQPDAPFSNGLTRQPFQSEEVVVKLVSRVRDWKGPNLLLRKLQILLSVFANIHLCAIGLYRFLIRLRQCLKETGNRLRTFTWSEALLKPQDLVLVLCPLLG